MQGRFQETQKFTQWWLWSIIIVCQIMLILPFLLNSEVISEGQESILPSLSVLPVILLMLSWKQSTHINSEAIKLKVFPILSRKYYWKDISSYEIVNYEFVGFGIRFRGRKDWVYNVKGKIGLQLILKDGARVTIGTQKGDELKAFLEELSIPQNQD